MIRKIVLMLLMLLPLTAAALGMGVITVNSGLNQPLNARVELVAADPEQLEDIKAELASAALFEKAGLERPFVLSKLRFQPRISEGMGVFVQITSRQAIVEPFLNFLLEVNVNGGRFLREYTILLDPLPFRTSTESGTSKRPSRSVGERYGPVIAGETLWKIAQATRPDAGITVEQMMLALQRQNPKAFSGGNINHLKRGVVLDIPQRKMVVAMGAAEAERAFLRQTQRWRAQSMPEKGRPPSPVQVATKAAEDTAQEGEMALKVVESREPLPTSSEGHITYPAGEFEKLRETILDTEGDLAAARDINNGLTELKNRLELRIGELRQAMAKRDDVIEALTRQLDELERAGRSPSPVETRALEPSTDEGSSTLQLSQVDSEERGQLSLADRITGFSPSSDNGELSWINNYWQLLVAVVVVIATLVFGILWLGGRRNELGGLHPNTELFHAVQVDIPDAQDSLLIKTKPETLEETVSAVVERESSNSKSDVASVMMEVDIYLAYRRFSQAESLITSAMVSFPESAELKAKLLEIYLFQANKEAFSDYLDDVHLFLSRTSPALWERVAEMGRDLVPDHPALASVATARQRGSGGMDSPALGVGETAHSEGVDDLEIDIDIDSLLDTDSVLADFVDDGERTHAWDVGTVTAGDSPDLSADVDEQAATAQKPIIEELISIDDLDLADLEEIDFDFELKQDGDT
ncbi:MAG: FimV/HubP family polar landmark protein [Candidatus Sedimenticola sp. (ex Thyasira tokunagai)]